FGVGYFLAGGFAPACPIRAVFTGRVGVPFRYGSGRSGGFGFALACAGMDVIDPAAATTLFAKVVHGGGAGIVGNGWYRCCSKGGKRGDRHNGALHVSPRIVT